MAEKAYVADYGPTASCTMRLCEPLQKRGKPYVVCGDSWFTSVKTVEALTNMGLFYSGVLNHRRWSPLPPRPAGGWHWRLCEP